MHGLDSIIKDSVWGKERLKDWLERSLFLSNAARRGLEVDSIILMRAMLPVEFDSQKRGNALDIIRGYAQYNQGSLLLPVFTGECKEQEYRIQANLLNTINDSSLSLDIKDCNRTYGQLISEWHKRVRGHCGDIKAAVFQGVHKFAELKGLNIIPDQYLPFAYRNNTLFLDWTRGSQTGEIAKKLLAEEDINRCFIYGGCGFLDEYSQIDDLLVPTSVIIEDSEEAMQFCNLFHDYKIMDPKGKTYAGGMLNVHSPHTETNSQLTDAASKGLMGVEMELYSLVKAIKESGKSIEIGALYYCTDTPLKSDEVRLNSGMEYRIVECISSLL